MGERLSEGERELLAVAMADGLLDGRSEPDREDLLDECRDLIVLIAPTVEAIDAARADRLAGKVRALHRPHAEKSGAIACPVCLESYPCRTVALLDRPPLPDRVDAVLRRSRNMREGLVEAIESGELAP